MVQILVAAK
jgi:hypothetical protein